MGEGGGRGGRGDLLTVYLAAMATLTRSALMTGEGTLEKARDAVAALLLPAKVICISG